MGAWAAARERRNPPLGDGGAPSQYRDRTQRLAKWTGSCQRGRSITMNEYPVTLLYPAEFGSASGWIYTAEAPPDQGEEIEIASANGRIIAHVTAIYPDGEIVVEGLTALPG